MRHCARPPTSFRLRAGYSLLVVVESAVEQNYAELLVSQDRWQDNGGSEHGLLVTAPVGRGRWTYVGLALWRQLWGACTRQAGFCSKVDCRNPACWLLIR